MNDNLYALLPEVIRERDLVDPDRHEQLPLRDLSQVMQEQVDALAADIDLLYDGWFVETCPAWLLPYIAALVGEAVPPSLGPEPEETSRALARARLVVPRRLVANAIRRRRRKGTRRALEDIVRDVGGWPAHAVESYRGMVWNQHLSHLRLPRGRFVDIRHDEALANVGGPMDSEAHVVDIRRVDARSPERPGLWNIPTVPVHAWRLQAFSITQALACHIDSESGHVYTFSALGNDSPLFARPSEDQPPVRLTRQLLASHMEQHYGEGKSVRIELGVRDDDQVRFAEIPADQVLVASLRRLDAADPDGWPRLTWPIGGHDDQPIVVIIDPEAGRLLFSPAEDQPEHVRVSYHYGFARAMGGGEYPRLPADAADRLMFRVGPDETYPTIAAALERWRETTPPGRAAIIEIADSGVYAGPFEVALHSGDSLEVRAAQGARPLIRILDTAVDKLESLTITSKTGAEGGGCFVLDGILIEGRGLLIGGNVDRVDIRHSTLVPGWSLDQSCHPTAPGKASLVIRSERTCVSITDSIVGPIHVEHNEVTNPAIQLRIADSIVDADELESSAVRRLSGGRAHAILDIRRSTIIGMISAHALEVGDDSLFLAPIDVERRQLGCLRFSLVPAESRGPSRYRCQPDLAIGEGVLDFPVDAVWPQFETLRYGLPEYARLYLGTSPALRRGAADGAEMGVYHDLYEAQRADSVRTRLAEFTPASMDAGLIFAS
jgi:hypothetical protein